MNMDHRPTHLPCNDDHVIDEDGDTAADFYFDDPALLFPLSPTSVLKEIVSLTPSSVTGSPLNTRLMFSKIRKTFRNQRQFLTNRPTIKRSSLSPGSEGTQSTTDWMEDEDDHRSYGSLTYSVETDQVLDDLDDDDEHLEALMMTGTVYCSHDTNEHHEEDVADPHKCFRLLDGVITAFQKIFQKPEPPPVIIPDQDTMCASIYEDYQQQNLVRRL